MGAVGGSGSDPDSIVFCRPSKQFSMKFLNRSKLTISYEKISETQNISKFFLRLEFYSRILLLVFDRNCSHPARAEAILKKPLFFTTSDSVEKKKFHPPPTKMKVFKS